MQIKLIDDVGLCYIVFGEIIVCFKRFKLNKTSIIICKYQIWSAFNFFNYF